MSIDAMMLLTMSTAQQYSFETWGRGKKREGRREQEPGDMVLGEFLKLSGRMISVIPYFSSAALSQIFTTMVSNPLYIGGGLALLNIIPSVVYMLEKNKESDLAKTAEIVSNVMGVAMCALNLVMTGILISTASAPLSLVSLVALTASFVFTAMSLAYTAQAAQKNAANSF